MKKEYWNSFTEFLVTSNMSAAIYMVSVCLTTLYLTNHPILFSLLVTVFSGTLVIYTMNRYTDSKEDIINNPRRFRYLNRYGKVTLTFAVVLYLLSLFYLIRLNLGTFLTALLPVLIAILYSVFRLKRVFLVKNIATSLGLLCAVLIVPVTFNDFTLFSLLLAAFFFLTFLVNTMIYDIKDVEGDVRYNISTLPGTYGLRNTQIVCYLLLTASVLCIPSLISYTPRSSLLLLYALYIGLYITFANTPDNLPSWYYGIVVDGEYLFLCTCCGIALALKMLS